MIGVLTQQSDQFGKALPVQVSHKFAVESAVFDDDNLVSLAGLVPVMTLAEQTGLHELLGQRSTLRTEDQVRIGEPGPEAVDLDRRDVHRRGQHRRHRRAAQRRHEDALRCRACTLDDRNSVAVVQFRTRASAGIGPARTLSALCERVALLPGGDERAFVDIDSLPRPVYGHAKQGASYGHTKIAGKQILRKGLSPLATTISTERAAPVIAGMRLRAGKAASGKGTARMVAQAIATTRTAGVTGTIMVRGDSAFGNRAVVRACRRHGARFSLVLTKNPAVQRAIDTIPVDAWTPVRYPGAVRDPDTGTWISDAEVAEIGYTAFASTKHAVTARLIVRRGKDARYPDALFPVWRYHPFFTDSDEPVAAADITHRRHAIIETVFADLIDGPLAHTPSGRFGANSAWVLCAATAHNLLRATGVIAVTATPPHADRPCDERSSPFQPDWPVRNADRSCTCPATGPG